MLELRDGVNTSLRWSSIWISVGRDRGGHDLVLLAGPEPDMRWHRFSATIGDTRRASSGWHTMVGLGAYPYRRAAHPPDSPLGDDAVGDDPSTGCRHAQTTIDLPGRHGRRPRAGAARARRSRRSRSGPRCRTTSSSMAYPAASVALIDGLARRMPTSSIDGTELRQEANRPAAAHRPARRRATRSTER